MRESTVFTRRHWRPKLGHSIALISIIALLWPTRQSDGADYFILRSPTGAITLTNLAPPATAQIVKRFAWPDVSDAQVAESQRRDELFWLGLKLEQLAESNDRLAAALQNAERQAGPSIEVNQVTVNLAPLVLPRQPHHHRHGRSR